jgi:hypothetical protein
VNNDQLEEHFATSAIPLLRTHFTDDAAWQRVVDQVTAAAFFDDDSTGYLPNIPPVEDLGLDGADSATVAASWDRGRGALGYVLLADEQSMREAAGDDDITVVFVDLSVTDEDEDEFGDVYGRAFRCVVAEVASIEVNLALANVDFSEFAEVADEGDGVFRGLGE